MDSKKDINNIDILVDDLGNLFIDFNFIEVDLDTPDVEIPDFLIDNN